MSRASRIIAITAAIAVVSGLSASHGAAQSSGAPDEGGTALVLARDISYSVDEEEQIMQTRGLAAALLSPDVQSAILGPAGPVTMAAFTWGGFWDHRLVADWTLLDSEAAIERFALRLKAVAPDYALRPTALGSALRFASELHRRNPYDCYNKVVDVSGDGVTNEGVWPSYHRENGTLAGLTINGLVIRNEKPDPLPHYLEEVIQGPGAFVIDINDYGDYLRAMREKLIRELSLHLSKRAVEQHETALRTQAD
ncbi:MAG: DUF1194 domain-containing protein [Neomegalonema sp.]